MLRRPVSIYKIMLYMDFYFILVNFIYLLLRLSSNKGMSSNYSVFFFFLLFSNIGKNIVIMQFECGICLSDDQLFKMPRTF